MKVKFFWTDWDMNLRTLEEEVNDFLATKPHEAILHVMQSSHATRTGGTDQPHEGYLISVWWDDSGEE